MWHEFNKTNICSRCIWKAASFCNVDGQTEGQTTHLPCTNVLILKPMVGLMVEMSSPLSFLRMVVFPALSRPLIASRQVHGRILRRKVEQRARRGYASLFLSSCSSVLSSRGPSQMSGKIQKRDRLTFLRVLQRSTIMPLVSPANDAEATRTIDSDALQLVIIF